MARPSRILNFSIEISDIDCGFYEPIDLRVAQHPSETDRRLLTRVIAYCLHAGEEPEFAKGGLSSGDEPAILCRDATGQITLWIDIGTPAPDRLHKATKKVERVIVYQSKEMDMWRKQVEKAKVFRRDAIEVYTVDFSLLKGLQDTLNRRNKWSLLRQDGALLISVGGLSLSSHITRLLLMP